MKKNEDEVSILKEKLAELERKAEAEKASGREFVSAVAHELRTPVAVIRGSLEALCDGVVSGREMTEEYHKQMLAESIYLQRLVTDLLEFSRLSSKGFDIIREPVCISDVLSDVCRSLRQTAKKKEISLTYIQDDNPYIVSGDYARLRQMFIVVLDNAVKFTPEGGSVTVKSIHSDDKLTVSIEDTGCGMAPEETEKIFEKFHRTMTSQNKNGSGLGLAIAREIAVRHDAEIRVKSKAGEGSEFFFEFSSKMTEKELEKFT